MLQYLSHINPKKMKSYLLVLVLMFAASSKVDAQTLPIPSCQDVANLVENGFVKNNAHNINLSAIEGNGTCGIFVSYISPPSIPAEDFYTSVNADGKLTPSERFGVSTAEKSIEIQIANKTIFIDVAHRSYKEKNGLSVLSLPDFFKIENQK